MKMSFFFFLYCLNGTDVTRKSQDDPLLETQRGLDATLRSGVAVGSIELRKLTKNDPGPDER